MSKPQEQIQAKVKTPLHLRLTFDDWTDSFKELTRAELGVFYAIRTLDPYGDRTLDLDCQELADKLGIHRTSVSKALKTLDNKGLIDLEITKARVNQKISNRRLTLLTTRENESNQEQEEEKTMCAPTLTAERPRSQPSAHAHICAPTLTDVRPRSQQEPESSAGKGFKISHTLTDFSNKSNTLSDSDERERFEKFCQRKLEQLPKMPSNKQAYIRKYREDLYAEFQEQEARRKETDEQIQASKAQSVSETPPTAANLHKRWLIKGIIRKDAIAKALELGYVVTPQGIFDPSEDPSEGKSSGGAGGGG